MHLEQLPILIILVISVLANNHTVSIAAAFLLLVKLAGFGKWLPFIETQGLGLGIILITISVLTPLVSGQIDAAKMLGVFKTLEGIVAILVGVAVAWIAAQGVPFMKSSPDAVTALMVGTVLGVCFLRGIAVGPLIAGGMVALIVSLLRWR